jgi:flagellar motor protein MotB
MKKNRRVHFRRRAEDFQDDHAWAVSYVDLLTLLLSFFIIFFSVDKGKKDGNNDYLDMIISGMNFKKNKVTSNGIEASSSANGKTSSAEGKKNHQTRGIASIPSVDEKQEELRKDGVETIPNHLKVLQKINMSNKLKDLGKVVYQKKSLYIEIPDVSFFHRGKKYLNKDGKKVVRNIIEMLRPYKEKIKITVQGHTDPGQYYGRKARRFNNWELSVMRAAKVLRVFMDEGYNSDALSAEGFASHKKHSRIRKYDEKQYKYLRRVTFKIQEREL